MLLKTWKAWATHAAGVQVAHGVARRATPSVAAYASRHELQLPLPLPLLGLRKVAEGLALQDAVLQRQRLPILHNKPNVERCAGLALHRGGASQLLKPVHGRGTADWHPTRTIPGQERTEAGMAPSSNLSTNSPKQRLQYCALMLWNMSRLSTRSSCRRCPRGSCSQK